MSSPSRMNVERYLRLVAGLFVLVSVVLAQLVSPYFLVLTGLVGLNLLQSAFTEWCPLVALLRVLHVPSCKDAVRAV